MRIYPLSNSSILRMYAERDRIELDPEYQRMGDVWTLEKRQLFVDSIINEYDIPKIYFHEYVEPQKAADGRLVRFAVIDGKQRLRAIWDFLEDGFPLSDDIKLLQQPDVDISGMRYSELARSHPNIKILIDGFQLPIVAVVADDIENIEEMFSRLNEAVPLNAAEKRNAIGGVMARTIRDIATHRFFERVVPLPSTRYRHLEVAAKFLLLTYGVEHQKRITDTKKVYLDEFVREHKKASSLAKSLARSVNRVLDGAIKVFPKEDTLLRTQAMTVLYFLLLHRLDSRNLHDELLTLRPRLVEFERERKDNRRIAESDISEASYAMLEFDRMTMQGANDASSIRTRLEILWAYLNGKPLDRYLQVNAD